MLNVECFLFIHSPFEFLSAFGLGRERRRLKMECSIPSPACRKRTENQKHRCCLKNVVNRNVYSVNQKITPGHEIAKCGFWLAIFRLES